MKLALKNVGKIRDAEVEINGITVVAGENDTGKSTIGKTLFAVFNSFHHIADKIQAERIDSVNNQLQALIRESASADFWFWDTEELAREIIQQIQHENFLEENCMAMIYNTILRYDEKIMAEIANERILDTAERIVKILSISDEEIFKNVLQRNLDIEFNGQIGNIYDDTDCSIQLRIRNEDIDIKLLDNKVTEFNKWVNLGTEAIYMDDPFVLDEISARTWRMNAHYLDHRSYMKKLLSQNLTKQNVVDEIVANEKFEEIYKKISAVCTGDVVREKRTFVGYRVDGKILEVKNMSTGLKTFAILKNLLINGYIKRNGTIILDEPEIHLHPEWQLLFAELIVLMHCEFGLHILLNTHSPYFLNAIEVYAAKYHVADKCKYYLTQNDGMTSSLNDVTDHIEAIYRKLARPLQNLENERYRYD